MTNAPDSRKTHVIRIVGTNANGDVLQDIWADVERTDVEKHVTQMLNSDWQGRQRKLKWMDDPDGDNYNPDGNPARKTKIVKVCSPDEADVNNPVQWIPIPAIKSMKSLGYDGNDHTGTQDDFRTGIDDPGLDPTVTTRVVEVRKIVHYDTNIDDAAQAAFDADPTRTAYVVKGSGYTKKDGSDGGDSTKDDGQFVDHEIIKYMKGRGDENNPAGAINRGVQTKLLNKYLIDQSEPADGKIVGSTGINPPYRLDRYQTIVNVKLKTIYLFVSLSGSNQSFSLGPYGPAPSVSKPTISASKNDKKTGVRLLDTVKPSGGPNNSGSGFEACFPYLAIGDLVTSWIDVHAGGGRLSPVAGVCPIEVPPGDPTTTSGPINYQAFASAATFYLFQIPADDDLVTVDIGGVIANFDSGLDTSNYSQTTKQGNVGISLRVYSTVHGNIWADPAHKKVSDLIDFLGDGKPRPTEDDAYSLGVTSSNQGKFTVNVHLDKNKADAQTDNYGKSFQPYKVTLTPSTGGTDAIPSQPPPRLPT